MLQGLASDGDVDAELKQVLTDIGEASCQEIGKACCIRKAENGVAELFRLCRSAILVIRN